jgi:phage-related protein
VVYLLRYNAVAEAPTPFEKPLHWVGSSKRDLLDFPADVVDDFGFALGIVQAGGTPLSAKPWKGEGAGVLELVEDRRVGTWRTVYTVRFEKAVYVLHCFQKKAPSGNRTALTDVALIRGRLRAAREDYETRYGKKA